MAFSSSCKPQGYAELLNRILLVVDNLYELTFNDNEYVRCLYFSHRKQHQHSGMYVILYEYTLKK